MGKSRDMNPDLWNAQTEETLIDLLEKMAVSLGYEFDRVSLKRNIYRPIGHNQVEQDLTTIRTELVELLSGKKGLPVSAVLEPSKLSVQVPSQSPNANGPEVTVVSAENPKKALP
jgi:hypothetical protein